MDESWFFHIENLTFKIVHRVSIFRNFSYVQKIVIFAIFTKFLWRTKIFVFIILHSDNIRCQLLGLKSIFQNCFTIFKQKFMWFEFLQFMKMAKITIFWTLRFKLQKILM